MKHLLCFFCLWNLFTAFGAEKAELTIYISDSRGGQSFAYIPEVKVLKNGTEFKVLNPGFSNKLVLPDLEPATYTVVYESIFHKEVRLELVVNEPKKYTLTAHVNYLDYSKEVNSCILDRLEENDSYYIIIESRGCFHSYADTVVILRNQSDYAIHWGKHRKVLTKDDLETIRHFEMELRSVSGWGCTTKDNYTIQYKGVTEFSILDGGCRWNGNDYLYIQLFGEEED